MKKKIIGIMACLILITINMSSVRAYASEESTVYDISFAQAESVVVNHVIQVMNNNPESPWINGVKINERKVIFDKDDEIIEYYFGLCDRENEPCGYIITGADSYMYPIIEYSDEGESFVNKAADKTDEKGNLKNIKSSKVYYGGDIFYAIEHTLDSGSTEFYDITTSSCEETDKESFPSYMAGGDTYNIEWDKSIKLSGNPPDSGDEFITNPNSYESNYNDSRYYTIDNGYRYYNIMTDFSSGGVCAPTAATNLCMYWYLRDTTSYINLFKNASWNDTFWSLYDYMGTKLVGGTSDTDIVDGYRLFFEEQGLSCSAYLNYGTNSGMDIVNELNNNRPCHLIVYNHYLYTDHSVLAVGYSQFIYNNWYGNSYSTYIRIADGWTNYPSRYVWGSCSGSWDYIVVIPD